ncbi:hypothetical protein SBRCBS47491_009706 [Sporothrix bragantina]|uniref:Xylanolytic transcriptional activator regulatory domain-containing protein n=1 Tax=Sporothrix bragantina TaxID=671064 RepID=A0ABP0CZN2_9PEZI
MNQAGSEVDSQDTKAKEQISVSYWQASPRLAALETPPSDSGLVGDGVDGDGDENDNANVSDDNVHRPFDDYNGMAIDTTDRISSLMLQSGPGGPVPDLDNNMDSCNARGDAISVASSIATGSTDTGSSATRQSFRTDSGQTNNIPLAELDIDSLFSVGMDSSMPTSAGLASGHKTASGETGPQAINQAPKDVFNDHQNQHLHAGSMQQQEMPSSSTAAAAEGRRPTAQQTPLPLPSYMDLDLTSFMYSPPGPSDQTMGFGGGEEPRSLLQDLGQFHLPNNLMSLSMGLGQLSAAVYPTAMLSDAPQMAVNAADASRSRSASVGNASDRPRRASPVLIRDGRRSFPSFAIHGSIYASLKADLSQRLQTGTDPLGDSEIPSPRMCADFLASYVSNFHGHLPIIHLPTFSPGTQPSPLVFIMCSIGALYRLDRKRARRLYETARKALDNTAPATMANQPSMVKGFPLWSVQTRVLLTFYAIMSGDMDLTTTVMRENGVYTIVYHEARTSLQEHQRDDATVQPDWQSWVTIESWKRLLGSMLICSTLIMVVYNRNPGMNTTMDLEFAALEDEKLWNAQSSAEWRELYDTRSGHANTATNKNQQQPASTRTMKAILADIMNHPQPKNTPQPVYKVSAFSGFILMHAIVVHMWQRAQVLQALASSNSSCPGFNPADEVVGNILVGNGLQTLARCQAFLDSARNEISNSGCSGGTGSSSDVIISDREDRGDDENRESEENSEDDKDAEKEASLVFNSNAILRIAHARLLKADSVHSSIDLTSLQGNRVADSSIDLFVNSKMERGTFVLKAVEKAFEGLREPVRIGHLLVRKTAAFRWGVVQAVAGWDCALLVSKYVHVIEMDVLDHKEPTLEEREFCEKVKDVLREADHDVEDNSSLAAAVAKTWSWFLRDVWIWGITPVMGEALDQVAEAYEQALAFKKQIAT